MTSADKKTQRQASDHPYYRGTEDPSPSQWVDRNEADRTAGVRSAQYAAQQSGTGFQVVSPHPKSENVELQRQLDAVLSCQPIDEDAAQELIRSIASVQYSAIDADEYESIRLRRIFAQHPVMRELDAKLLKTTVSAIRVYSVNP